MSISPSNLGHHTLHAFDVELDRLDGMLSNVIDLLLIQLELSIQSIEKSDRQYAADAGGLTQEIAEVLNGMDARVLAIIARFSPVANDLRTVVSFSKIADQLEKVAREIADFGVFVNAAFLSSSEASSPALIADVIEIGRYVLEFLHKLKIAIDAQETETLFDAIEADPELETGLHNKLQAELIGVIMGKAGADAEKMMKIMNLLEFCPGELRRIFALVILNRLSDNAFRRKWVAEAAYFMAEHRNFTPGWDVEDWFRAEQDFQDRMLRRYEAIAHEYGGMTVDEINAFHEKKPVSGI